MDLEWQWESLINDRFKPLLNDESRYLNLVGGRGSSKTDLVAKLLIYRCLIENYFRYILIRKTYRTIKESQYRTIKDLVYELGLNRFFRFVEHPYQITCFNGNKFIAAGMDEPKKIKSVKDPTGAWWEEEIPDEGGFITVTTSIRTMKAKYLQEIFTVNPEVVGNYEDNWYWKLFFKGRPANYSGNIEVDLAGSPVNLSYTNHHSTHWDNKWLPAEFRAFLENLKHSNPYYYQIYTLGNWGNRITGDRAYKAFDMSKHVRAVNYDDKTALHLTFDFNVRPYLTLCVWQVNGTKAKQIDEILGKDPDNNTAATCKLFAQKYKTHTAGVFIYGDPSGKAEDTRSEKGHNDFSIILKELKHYHPKRRLLTKAPAVVARINWINSVFAIRDGGIRLIIGDNCKHTITDYFNGREDSDGTKLKEKTKDKETGISHELYHHITDANDYFLCKIFAKQYANYLRGGKKADYMTFKQHGRTGFNQY